MTLVLALAALVTWTGHAFVGQPPPPPRELASQLQSRYAAVTDFTADFVHTYEGGLLRTRATERGTVLIKKPGRMRWTYTAPERKLFVADGRLLYAYIPEDRQVTVIDLPPGDEPGAATWLLAGKGQILRDFEISAADPSGLPPGSWAVRLVPRREQPDYDWLILAVDPERLGLRMLVTGDAQGGRSTFLFSNVRENTNIPDREFVFTIPRGVEVIR